MKKIVFIFIFISITCLFSYAMAENLLSEELDEGISENSGNSTKTQEVINENVNKVGNAASGVAKDILDQITVWSLPFCAVFVVYGAILYFIMGIRNLYKKRQGVLFMFGSVTFYVVALFVNLVFTFLSM